jgi:hypothetical protein
MKTPFYDNAVFIDDYISHIKKAPKHFIFLKFVKKLKTKGEWG